MYEKVVRILLLLFGVGLVAGALPAPAIAQSGPEHHSEASSVWQGCFWKSEASYEMFGQPAPRILIVRDVIVNGVPYSPDWTPDHQFVAQQSFAGDTTGVPDAESNTTYILEGTYTPFPIFEREGRRNSFIPTGWSGQVELYKWSSFQEKWVLDDTDEILSPGQPLCPYTQYFPKAGKN